MIETRNVTKKEISKSFRGILRVSPGEDNADTGLEETTEKVISDSVGNESTLFLGQKSATITNLTVNDLKVPGDLTFNTITEVDTSVPKENEILIGDGANNYTIKDLLEIIKDELVKYNIFASIVPVGTVFYSAMKSRDITNLPSVYQNDYLIPSGQSLSTTDYPELFQVLGYTFGGSGTSFNLPNLDNKFVRCAGDAKFINEDEGYTIPEHTPGMIEAPQTNPYIIKDALETTAVGEFRTAYGKHNNVTPYATGCFSVKPGSHVTLTTGYWRTDGWLDLITYRLNLIREDVSLDAKETAPYNITLVPLIKIR